ncbi:hypothetical protein [Curtobacterium flaccumfaciens]|uniref:hypothetical protein n=1 Tax=Curtobacterium flaccumfaciens TaxID=2035 RepID=UPI001ADC5CEC|nr:hypothetical protein [Curtobacterium flaccumfaciens]MBO9051767.1 hypothetical protein [Curtobacterium flaccumfaciens pv. flaccumfaciens]
MNTISKHYGLSGALPFVDVDLDDDNRLYVDPHAIRLSASPQPYARKAVECMDGFFDGITNRIISGTKSDLDEGEQLLQTFREPWETRLGMAASGFRGHGGAEEIGTLIMDALRGSVAALIRVGVFKHLEDMPLFVEGVDKDITSDITTRLVYSALADFTAQMVSDYPEFRTVGDGVRSFQKQVWDPVAGVWNTAIVELPVVNGQELLLVPRLWARRTLLMSAGRFYETTVLSYAQLEQAVRTADGKLLKTPKDRLKERGDLQRGRDTNRRVTGRALQSQEDLVKAFTRFVDGRYRKVDVEGEDKAA